MPIVDKGLPFFTAGLNLIPCAAFIEFSVKPSCSFSNEKISFIVPSAPNSTASLTHP
jgi:hypothetical protein